MNKATQYNENKNCSHLKIIIIKAVYILNNTVVQISLSVLSKLLKNDTTNINHVCGSCNIFECNKTQWLTGVV